MLTGRPSSLDFIPIAGHFTRDLTVGRQRIQEVQAFPQLPAPFRIPVSSLEQRPPKIDPRGRELAEAPPIAGLRLRHRLAFGDGLAEALRTICPTPRLHQCDPEHVMADHGRGRGRDAFAREQHDPVRALGRKSGERPSIRSRQSLACGNPARYSSALCRRQLAAIEMRGVDGIDCLRKARPGDWHRPIMRESARNGRGDCRSRVNKP